LRFLGGLGSHDLSAMREVLGMPEDVIAVHVAMPFWCAIFDYGKFAVTYESGIDDIPRFDAHIEVYGKTKDVRIQYDTNYIKGLPVLVHIKENVNGAYVERTLRRTYEDPYTLQMIQLYDFLVHGKSIKTTAEDALKDIEIFKLFMTKMQ